MRETYKVTRCLQLYNVNSLCDGATLLLYALHNTNSALQLRVCTPQEFLNKTSRPTIHLAVGPKLIQSEWSCLKIPCEFLASRLSEKYKPSFLMQRTAARIVYIFTGCNSNVTRRAATFYTPFLEYENK